MESFPWESLFVYLGNVVVITSLHTFLLVGVGMILGVLITFLSRTISTHAGSVFPRWLYACLISPGVVLHEIAHWFFLMIFGYQIKKVRLFQCKRDDRRFGYVEFGSSGSYFQRVGGFFASVGPIVVGSLVIYILSVQLLGTSVFESSPFIVMTGDRANLLGAFGQLVQGILLNTERIFSRLIAVQEIPLQRLALFVYLTFTIVNGMELSRADLNLARPGLFLLIASFFLINLLTLWAGGDLIGSIFMLLSRLLSGFYAIMVFVLLLDVLLAFIVVPLGTVFGRKGRW